MKYTQAILRCKKKLPKKKKFSLCMRVFNDYKINSNNLYFPQFEPLIAEFLEFKDDSYEIATKFIAPEPHDKEFEVHYPFIAKEYFKRAIKYNRVLPVSGFSLKFYKKYDFLSYKMSIIWNKHFPKLLIQNMDVICKLLRGVPIHKVLRRRFELTLTAARLEQVVESLRIKRLKKLNLF